MSYRRAASQLFFLHPQLDLSQSINPGLSIAYVFNMNQ
jgi:hypothetical protein